MIRYLCPNQSSLAVSGLSRAPARLIFTREDHARSVESCFGCFDWLEGATGVRLAVRVRPDLVTIGVTGEIDLASVDIIAGVVRDAMMRTRSRVALDLSGVTFIDDAAAALLAQLRAKGCDAGPKGPLPTVPRRRARG